MSPSIIIPEYVEKMGENVFKGCSSLEKIYCKAKAQPKGWSSNWNSENKPVVWGYKEK